MYQVYDTHNANKGSRAEIKILHTKINTIFILY